RARAVMNVALTEDKYSEAVELYDRALARSPASVGAAAGMANVLAVRAHYLKPNAAVEDMRRADGLIKAALAAAPDSAGVHYVMGQVLRLQGHCEEAIDEYQAAIALNRNYADAYAFLGACLLYTGRISPLMPLLTKAVRLDPTNKGVGWVYLRAGVATLFETRNDEAIIWLEKARAALAARQLRDDLSATHSWLAAVYGLNGDTSRASAALAQAKAVGPFPKSIGDFCGRGCWCENPAVKSLVNDTYYKGLQLAGWSEQ
ncbi:MAG TPA: tetratricopeptide repeat protein, partial [Stellaceae bacterium]|nr:tetratricopeptide repeat protein [Stellaceae bacterium]